MYIVTPVLLLLAVGFVESMPGGPGVPENITVTFLNPSSIKVSWANTAENIDKYDVTYKPTDASYRVVAVVAGNSNAVTLTGLKANTQYQLTVAAVWAGKKYRSRPIVFRTLESPRSSPQQDHMASLSTELPSTKATSELDEMPDYQYPVTSSTVRGVEIGIVLMVLLVWVGAIALFFNRWGKIRMLLPYQPDYKQEQLKVPGTAACAAAIASGNTCNHHSGDHICQQRNDVDKAERTSILQKNPCSSQPRKHRPRINSAIFVSNSGPGIDPKEFFRRHGSVSKLCRKARSVDNISLEEKHFGLPTLSISGPSPPEDEEQEEIRETEQFLLSE